MEQFFSFFNKVAIHLGEYTFTFKQLTLSILVVVIGYFLSKYLQRYSRKQNIVKRLSNKQLLSLIRFIRMIIFLVTAYLFAKALGLDIASVFNINLIHTEKVTIKIHHLFVFYFLFMGTHIFIDILEILFNEMVSKQKVESGKGRSVFQIIKYFVYTIAFTLFLESLGFSITVILASLSAFLVGLGLGIQNFFNDIVSGIVILFDRSVKVGDIVETADDVVGRVDDISLRTSKIVSRDDVILIVPNSQFTSDQVINWSHNTFKTRFHVDVGVAYGSDVRLVEKLLTEVAHEHSMIDNKPKPFVFFTNFGDSSLDFRLHFFTVNSFRVEHIKSDLRFAINDKFIENNISIPFPQRDVHLIKE